MPHTRGEVCYEGEWAETFGGKQFLLAEDGEGDVRIIIFSTEENLRILIDAEAIFVDGTFHTCPDLFYQIFTIHAVKFGKHFPLVYCLLPNKARETYESVPAFEGES